MAVHAHALLCAESERPELLPHSDPKTVTTVCLHEKLKGVRHEDRPRAAA